MKALLILALLAPAAHAAELQPTADKSAFAQVLEWFDQGTNVTFDEISTDYQIGRCFSEGNPNAPRAGIFVSVEQKKGEDMGPGFPSEKTRKLFDFTADPRYGADVFDHFPYMPGGENGIPQLNRAIQDGWNNYSALDDSGSLTYYRDIEPNNRPDDKIEVAAYEDYIVTKATNLIRQRRGDKIVEAGEVWYACYYFIRSPK